MERLKVAHLRAFVGHVEVETGQHNLTTPYLMPERIVMEPGNAETSDREAGGVEAENAKAGTRTRWRRCGRRKKGRGCRDLPKWEVEDVVLGFTSRVHRVKPAGLGREPGEEMTAITLITRAPAPVATMGNLWRRTTQGRNLHGFRREWMCGFGSVRGVTSDSHHWD
ncbi:hypothetical protein BJV77DRAFT_968154 [Russula vinacea]|nr:hypothetical protein BJV77DRAFT_968154 [Russula vinacea]